MLQKRARRHFCGIPLAAPAVARSDKLNLHCRRITIDAERFLHTQEKGTPSIVLREEACMQSCTNTSAYMCICVSPSSP